MNLWGVRKEVDKLKRDILPERERALEKFIQLSGGLGLSRAELEAHFARLEQERSLHSSSSGDAFDRFCDLSGTWG